jgi:hypothetical protein
VKSTLHSQRRLAHFADSVNRMAPGLAKMTQGKGEGANWQPSAGWDEGEADENGLVRVNNPARDLRFSPFAGYTQNQSAAARCGDSVVVAFNDSGSVLETLLTGTGGVSFVGETATGTGGVSFSGVASSRNGGESFKDRGAVPPGPDVDTFLVGRPSVACSDPDNFYIVQDAGVSSSAGHFNPLQAITLSRSTDGGATWGDPVTLIASPFFNTEFFDDSWVAVDPSNHKRVYVSYRHIFGSLDCGLVTTVEVLSSNDGGQTFGSTPQVVDTQCFAQTFSIDIGTRMAVSSKGTVYVAWENDALFTALVQQAIQVGSFTPGGPSTTPVTVDAVTQGGLFIFNPPFGFKFFDSTALQGAFENLRGFDMAVDHSGGSTDGTVYVAWDDGRNGLGLAPEFEDDFTGFYSFTDIFYSTSADGGQTFTPTRQLNSDSQPLDSRGHDHFRPTLAVDGKGKVAACWYDRRNDAENYQFERFCAESTDTGATWVEFPVQGSLSTPSRGQDLILPQNDMGQNDNLTTDFNGHAPGFLGGIQWMSSGMNPDVKLVRFR